MTIAGQPGGAWPTGALVVESQRTEPWLGIEIRHFAALEALATERSFQRAAGRLGYSQGAVSQQLAALERVIGVKLVNRGGGSELALTEAGERLLLHVKAIRSRIQTAQHELHALAMGSAGILRVGAYQTIAPLLPGLLSAFRRSCPEMLVAITNAAGDCELQQALHRDELDVAFVDMPAVPHPAIKVDELIGDEYVLVVAPTAGYFGGRDEVAPDHLRGVPLVGFRRSRSTELLLWSLRSCGVEPELLLRSDDIVFLRAFAAAGAGVAILPRLATEMADTLRVVRLRDVHTLRKIGVAYRSEASGVTPAVREFAEAAHRACGDLVHQSPWLRRLRSAERTS